MLYRALILLTAAATVSSSGEEPQLVVQTGHSSSVNALCFTPDGKRLVSGGWDHTLKVWDVGTGKEVRTLKGHAHAVSCLSISPDGRLVASGSKPLRDDGVVKLWELETGREILTFRDHAAGVTSVRFSPDGRYVASSAAGGAKIWDVQDGRVLMTLEAKANSLAFTPGGRYLVTAGGSYNECELKIWDLKTGQAASSLDARPAGPPPRRPPTPGLGGIRLPPIRLTINTRNGTIKESRRGPWYGLNCVAISPDGRLLASAGGFKRKGEISLWDFARRKKLRTITGHARAVRTIDFSPDGKFLASGDWEGTAKLWDTATGKEVRSVKANRAELNVNAVVFSPDGALLATDSGARKIKLWDVGTGKEVRTLGGAGAAVKMVRFSPGGRMLASVSGDRIRLWDLHAGRVAGAMETPWQWIRSIAFHPDGKLLASGGTDNDVTLWDIKTCRLVRKLTGHTETVNSVCFSPDGEFLATGSEDKTARIWRVSSGEAVRTFGGHAGTVGSVRFGPRGKVLATCVSLKEVKLWDVASGRELHALPVHRFMDGIMRFSRDGNTLFASPWNRWDIRSGARLAAFEGKESRLHDLRLSPDGRLLAMGSYSSSVRVWDVETSRECMALRGHTDDATTVDFSPDGRFLASGSDDGTVRLWDVARTREVARLIGLGRDDYAITTPDNYYLASKRALKDVAFRVGNRDYMFDQFDLKLNRPDIVLDRIGYSQRSLVELYRRAYQKRLRRMGFTEGMLGREIHLPEVEMASRGLPVSTLDKRLTFTIRAWDSSRLLTRLNVYVNDVPLYGAGGIGLSRANVRSVERAIDLDLCNGRNKIEVSVLNENGAESLKRGFEVRYIGDPAPSDRFVLVIGVSRYYSKGCDLKYAAKDARDLAQLMRSPREQMGKVNVLQLLDYDATRAGILKARSFLEKAKVDDQVVVFLAGHGVLDRNLDYYFAPTDMDFGQPARKGVSYQDIEGLLDGIAARQKILLMDTCYSGELDKEDVAMIDAQVARNVRAVTASRGFGGMAKTVGQQNTFRVLRELFADLRRGTGAVVISSASGVEFALESEKWRNGVFTYCILEGLKTGKADLNSDDAVRVSELTDYVVEKVQQLTAGRQTPTVRRENIEFDFRVD